MNKIDQELAKTITQSRKDIPVIQECYSILEKHCVAFGKFCRELSKHNKDILRQNPDITEEQLFELYIKSL
jgi:hypothetical protein